MSYLSEWQSLPITPTDAIENLFWSALQRELEHLMLFVLDHAQWDRGINITNFLPESNRSTWTTTDGIRNKFSLWMRGPEQFDCFSTVVRAILFASGTFQGVA